MTWAIIYLACQVAAFLVGVVAFVKLAGRPVLIRWIAASCPCLFLIGVSIIVQAVWDAPYRHWNGIRIVPTVSLLSGYTLYYGKDSGPVTGNIYAPLSALAYLPAAWATSPTEMIRLGTLISLGLYFGPVAWLYIRLPKSDHGPPRALARAYTFALLPLVTFNMIESLGYSAAFIHADAPALGLAAGACAVLYADPFNRWRALVVSALLAVLSVWSKQVMGPLVLGLPVWLLCASGFQACWRYGLCLVLSGLVVGGLVCACFNPSDLWFNLVTVPGNHPWTGQFPGNIARVLLELQNQSILLAVIMAFGVCFSLARSGYWPGLSRWLSQNRWTVFAVGGLFVVPTSLLGRLKEGGDLNALSFTLYLFVLAVCLMMREGMACGGDEPAKAGLRALTVVVITINGVLLIQGQCQRYLNLAAERANVPEIVQAYIQKHPGEAYFPWNPLAHLMVEGRLYHFDYGLFDRELANYPVSAEHFRQCIPESMRRLCFPKTRNFEYVRKYLPEFKRRVEIAELPEFICYERN